MLHYVFFLLASPAAAFAQSAAQPPVVPPITLPTVVVTAQKEPADARRLPVSVSVMNQDAIDGAGLTTVSEAAIISPNTAFAELSARKVSNVFIRGIGSSPANPGVTTYIDGVPQLHANSANVELLDVEQIEFVRGPQSALFGRNTLGGLVNVTSGRPSLTDWTGRVEVPMGSDRERGVTASVSGPVAGAAAVGLSFGRRSRDGFTINEVTGHDLDSRSATFGRAQLLWMPAPTWETRLIVSGERDRDGDYALNDLDALRRTPFRSQRDVEGRTERDIWSSTVLLRREGPRYTFSSTTGFVSWSTDDLTDLDYSPYPAITRTNEETARQFTQEFRLASAAQAPARLSDRATLAWQTGAVFFTQDYTQDAVNSFAPHVLSPFLAFPVSQHSPQAALDDLGLAVYGLGTLTLRDTIDLTVGARVDHERKTADLRTFYAPVIAPPTTVNADRVFSDVSPQAAIAWRPRSGRTAYLSVSRGFKAGGFNPASPAGSENYGEEHAWNAEGGVKTLWANGRVSANAAVFRISWDDMQLNVPNPHVPAQFFIANVGHATSTGFELDVNARPHARVDLFGTFGLTHGRFGAGSRSSGVDVTGNELPNAPGYTASMGLQCTQSVGRSMSGYGRAEVVFYGAYHYDDLNSAGQDAYALANVRAGLRIGRLLVEGWVKNAFDTRYIPVAFAYSGLAPSGFLGENGRPRTVGVTTRVLF